MSDQRCDTCPVLAGPCPGQRWDILCTPAASPGPFRDMVIDEAMGGPRRPLRRPADPPADVQIPALEHRRWRERFDAENCLNLEGCLCGINATCKRAARPTSLPADSSWPAVQWRDCLACVRADEDSPRV